MCGRNECFVPLPFTKSLKISATKMSPPVPKSSSVHYAAYSPTPPENKTCGAPNFFVNLLRGRGTDIFCQKDFRRPSDSSLVA